MPVSIYPQNISIEMVAHRIDLIFTFLIRAAEFSDAPEIKLAAWNCMVMGSSEGFEPKFKHGLNLLLWPLSLRAMCGAQPTSLNCGGKPELENEISVICR